MTFTYKNKVYQLDKEYWKGECINDSIDFQQIQLDYCVEDQDFNTLENRINNMLTWGGILEIK